MAKNNMQEQSVEIMKFVAERLRRGEQSLGSVQSIMVESISTPQIQALGLRLCSLMIENFSPQITDEVSDIYKFVAPIFMAPHAYPANAFEHGKATDAAKAHVNTFERAKKPKQANFCRTLVFILDAMGEPMPVPRAHYIGRACAKAHWAGASNAKIKNTILLLFG